MSSEKKEKNRLLLTEEGRKLSGELLRVEKDLHSVCMEGISDEEQKQMEKLMGKIQENMIRFMVKEVPEDEPGLETEEAGETIILRSLRVWFMIRINHELK